MLANTISYWEALGLLSTDCSSSCIVNIKIVNTKGKQAESATVLFTHVQAEAKTFKSNRRSEAGASQKTKRYGIK